MGTRNSRVSLRGLRTFCIVARLGSFRLAAEELFLTPSAISHQIKNLEDELDVKLFDRGTRQLQLTDAGDTLLKSCGPLIEQLDEAASQFFRQHRQRQLRVTVQPFFATELLVPRLSTFIENNADISIDLDTGDQSSEKHPAQADVSIRLFRKAPQKLQADELFGLRLVPACSPAFLRRHPGITTESLPRLPLIVHSHRRNAWRDWAAVAGLEIAEWSGALTLETMITVARAAEQGLGVALVPLPLSEKWFRENKLVRLSDCELLTPDRYFVVVRKEDLGRQEVAAFRSWILREFASDG
jgi:LysR family glycine cleavage system transcriptional activator